MSDLIDLTSPEDKKIRAPKLTSPLIPLPDDKDKPGESKHVTNPIINLEACGNLDDNPFDSALRKTSEFVSKSQDPFEIVWEKSMNSTGKSSNSTGDQSGKAGSKINKTVDEFVAPSADFIPKSANKSKPPIISIKPASPEFHDLSILDQSCLNDSFLLDSSVTGRPSTDRYLKRLASDFGPPSPKVNLSQSILNQSALNDSLSGTSYEDCAIKSIVAQRLASCVQQGIKEAEAARRNDGYLLQRSLSQGCQLSPHYSRSSRSRSTTGVELDKSFLEFSSREALLDPLNRGFLNTTRDTISDISAIRKFSSASGSSSTNTNNTINRAFITSTSVIESDAIKKSINSRLSSSFADISDLKAKLSLLKAKSSLGSMERTNNSSLVDPEAIFIEHNITSDSVFTDEQWKRSDDVRSLATKLEQMLTKSPKSNNSDELPSRIPSDTDSEVQVENLIELSSDTSNSTGLNSADKVQTLSQLHLKSNDNSSVDMVRELEKELIDAENKPVAATLLMDLKKLIKAENNPQAIELLKNLEKMLGVKCQSNADLLEIYMNPNGNPSSKNKDKNSKSSEDKDVKASNDFTDNALEVNSSKTSDSVNSSEDSKDKSHNSSTLKLIAGIQSALEKLLAENAGQPKLLLEKLNTVFSSVMSSEKTPASSPVKTARVSPMKNPGLSRSVTSIARRSLNSPTKKSFGLKRQNSVSQIPNSGTTRRSSLTNRSLRVDSPKKEIKPRLSSSALHVTESHSRVQQEATVKIKPAPVIGKNKLKKKPELEIPKKGPLKAVIPVGNMHRRASLGKRISPTTPSRSTRVSIGKTSTPNTEEPVLDCLKKPPKTKPLAASTPEGGYKNTRSSLPVPKSPRPSCSISPVTPKTPRVSSPRVTPKASPRVQNKNNSHERSQVRVTFSSPTTPKSSPRVTGTKEFQQRLSLSSQSINKPGNSRRSEPLRYNLSKSEGPKKIPGLLTEKNTPVAKVKPVNLASKFVLRRTGSFKLPEKENKILK